MFFCFSFMKSSCTTIFNQILTIRICSQISISQSSTIKNNTQCINSSQSLIQKRNQRSDNPEKKNKNGKTRIKKQKR